jgi:hypothetical protein
MANLSVRLDSNDLEDLRRMAGDMRVPYTILARMLIVQGLRSRVQMTEQ